MELANKISKQQQRIRDENMYSTDDDLYDKDTDIDDDISPYNQPTDDDMSINAVSNQKPKYKLSRKRRDAMFKGKSSKPMADLIVDILDRITKKKF